MNKEKNYLRHLIGKKKIKLKDVYCLLIQKPIKNREAVQSRYLHDEVYDEKLNGLCHRYLTIENIN